MNARAGWTMHSTSNECFIKTQKVATQFLCFLSVRAGPVEICQTETFKASCKEDEVIVMKSARYGRMHLGRCVQVMTFSTLVSIEMRSVENHCVRFEKSHVLWRGQEGRSN